MASEKIRKSIRFYGDVQGVGFRYKAKYAANYIRLTGWVKNEYDGTVFMEVQGVEGEIDYFINMLMDDRYIRITDMDVERISTVENERGFKVRSY